MLSEYSNANVASVILTMHPPTSSSPPMNSATAGAAKKSLQSFLDEHVSESDDHHRLSSARTSCVSAISAPLVRTAPCSVESPAWIRSPLTHIAPNYHCLASLYRSEGCIHSMTIAKNYVITSSSSRRIHAWKLPDCPDMGCINASTGEIHAVLASGNLLVSSHGDFRIRLWDVTVAPTDRLKAKKIATLPQRRPFFRKKAESGHKDRISCVAFNNVDMLVYTGSLDHTVKVWSIAKKRCINSFPAHDAQINAIIVNQQDGCVFTCSSDGKIKIWRRLCKESAHILTVTLKFQPSPINALALTNNTHSPCVLYSGSSDGLINFWTKEGASGRYNHGGFLQGHPFAVLCLVTVHDLVLSGSEDATIRAWRRDEGSSLHSCVAVIDGHHGPVKCLAAVMEGNEMVKGLLLVYSASLDQTLKVWRLRVCNEERSVMKVRKSETGENEECRMSPVLSPSWVQKKIQGTDYM